MTAGEIRILAALLCYWCASSMMVTINEEATTAEPLVMYQAGLLQGSSVEITLAVPSQNISAVFALYKTADYLEYNDLISKAMQFRQYQCGYPAALRVPLVVGANQIHTVIANTHDFVFVMTNCGEHDFTIKGTIAFENPHLPAVLRHLPAQSLGYPMLYIVLTASYCILFALWLGTLVGHRSAALKLHWCIAVPLALKAAASAQTAYIFMATGASGVTPTGSQAVLALLVSAADGSFQLALLAWSLGWCYTRDHLNRREMFLMCAFAVWYVASAVLFALAVGDIHTASVATVDILRMCTGITIFSISAREIAALRTQVYGDAWTPSKPRAYQLLSLYQNMRWCFFGYLMVPLTLGWVPVLSTDWVNRRFVGVLVDEWPQLVIFGIICYFLYPVDLAHYDVIVDVLGDARTTAHQQITAFLDRQDDVRTTTRVEVPTVPQVTRDNVGLLRSAELELPSVDFGKINEEVDLRRGDTRRDMRRSRREWTVEAPDAVFR